MHILFCNYIVFDILSNTLERYKTKFELDAKELEKYIDSVLRETKKEHNRILQLYSLVYISIKINRN